MSARGTEAESCLAIDIGGSKLAVGLVDREGVVLQSEQVRTPKATDAEALYRVLTDLVEIVLQETPAPAPRAVGIGCGGPMAGEAVSPLNIPAWREFPLAERLRRQRAIEALGIPVALENDAKALALAEGWKGAARGLTGFIAMVVSTGVGGGIVLDGRLLEGELGNAGHIGHVIVEPGGRPCGCGASGCLEAEASGLAIEAMSGTPAAEASADTIERCGRLVGRAVASVANLLDLRRAFVGGSVALGFGARFFLAAQQELDCSARLAFSRGARIEPVGLGREGPLVGAAAVGWRALGEPLLRTGS